ncbi:MAG: type I 3-dehydroquinate dehydratase [Candidatus Cloacimonadota bacterium]|nr:type I 3-dehydroquinate dehydratase [Candidatus Cloacimonadota bacterium]
MIILSIPANYAISYSKWKEYRLDFLEFLENFNKKVDQHTILTIRNTKEGGLNHFNSQKKLNFYKKMISTYNCLVDWEIESYKTSYRIPFDNLILSYHNFENFDKDFLLHLAKKANQLPCKYLKLAVPIENYSDLTDIEYIFMQSNKKILWAGLGKLGKLSRILHRNLGATGTYLGLQNAPTSSSQLNFQETRKYNFETINTNTKIGGIIGGKNVKNSLGLEFYNNIFAKKQLNAVYLPFIVDSLPEFLKWLDSFGCDKFFGFSVTMPSKMELASYLNKKEPINLYLPYSQLSYNTDITAFQNSLEKMGIGMNSTIIVWGYGGAATAFIVAARKFKDNIYVDGRNQQKLRAFCKKYNLKKVREKNQDCSLLVNCTPLGTKPYPLNTLKLPKFNKLIDLPYQNQDTDLVKLCRIKSLDFISGKEFWHWQAKEQLQIFLNEIKNKI